MTRILARVLLALVLGLGLHQGGVRALGAAEPAALSPDEAATVRRVVRYLNGISTLRSRFIQISSNGAYAEGEVLLKRPGKFRFDYDPPHPVLLIANGLSLLYYDRELKQASYVPLWETPLWFLIREKVTLSDTTRVTRVEQNLGRLRVTLQDSDAEDHGQVILVFSDRPLSLKKWELVDPQGIVTQVSLVNPQFGVAIDSDRFKHGDLELDGRENADR